MSEYMTESEATVQAVLANSLKCARQCAGESVIY